MMHARLQISNINNSFQFPNPFLIPLVEMHFASLGLASSSSSSNSNVGGLDQHDSFVVKIMLLKFVDLWYSSCSDHRHFTADSNINSNSWFWVSHFFPFSIVHALLLNSPPCLWSTSSSVHWTRHRCLNARFENWEVWCLFENLHTGTWENCDTCLLLIVTVRILGWNSIIMMFFWVCTLELETRWDLIRSFVRVPARFSSSSVHQSGNRKLFWVRLVLCWSSVIKAAHKVRLIWICRLELERESWCLFESFTACNLCLGCWWVLYLLWAQSTRLALANLLATHLLSNLVWDGCSCYDVLVSLAIMHVGIIASRGRSRGPDTDPNTPLLPLATPTVHLVFHLHNFSPTRTPNFLKRITPQIPFQPMLLAILETTPANCQPICTWAGDNSYLRFKVLINPTRSTQNLAWGI